MSAFVDILLLLDGQSIIRQVQLTEASVLDAEEVTRWRGTELKKIPDTIWDFEQNRLRWKGIRFEFTKAALSASASCILLRREPLRERLMEAALDLMVDAIQLYGADSSIQFFNRSSKQLLDVPLEEPVEGQYMLDFFSVDKEFSTTLTALRTQMPVHNRFDSYKSTAGKDLSTVNSSYPVVRSDGSLAGTVTLERDISMMRRQIPELQSIQRVLTDHLSSSLLGERNTRYTLDDIVGSSPQLREAVEMARRMAPKDINVLLQGETGTGKELFAQGIHALSSRRKEKFVAINCAAFPETLIEGMLFGTVKGAFTGSVDKAGLIETASNGTLFLDELNSMSLSMQAKLLRVLEEGTLQRVGGTEDIRVNIRVLSACNQDAFALAESGALRRDLFYRLASAMVEIPPLRERMDDLEELVRYYIGEKSSHTAQPIQKITPDFWKCLRQYHWPGNVRELFHILECAVSVSKGGILDRSDLPVYFLRHMAPSAPAAPAVVASDPELIFKDGLDGMVREYERQVLAQAYLTCGKNASRTAELLKISRQSFQYYRKKYGLR